MIIRQAKGGDFENLLLLGEKMRSESVVTFPPLDEGKVALLLKLSIEHPELAIIHVAEDDGLIGMITAMIGEYSFCYVERAVCDALFVLPERRGAIAAKKLILSFVDWARSVDAHEAIMGISTGIRPERTGKLFENLGFELIGHSYRMELNDV